MGSETEVQVAPAEPAASAAAPASGGSKTGMILAVVVVAVVVIAALAYVFVLDDGGDDGLSGQWTITGGTFEVKMVLNNDTANTTWINSTMPASTEVIDFDADQHSIGDVTFEDLGNGNFRITSFDFAGTDFGTIEGTYVIDGDTMTITINNASVTINDPTDGYIEAEMNMTWNFAAA